MRKIRQPPPTEEEDRLIPFLASLVAEDLSPKTVDGYRQDLLAFRRWYRESRGADLRWEKLGANDLISYRQLSNAVSERFRVPHESPQLLLIKNGECVYDESHMGITIDELTEQATQS